VTLHRQHPVRVLFDQVTNGGPLPTTAQLEDLLVRDDLPEGQSLTRFRRAIAIEAERCKELGQAGDHAQARAYAERAVAQLASKMTDEERAITNTHTGDDTDIREMTRRMFESY
jgi:hypothetical protein